MGISSMLDVVGSIVIGCLFFLLLFNLNSSTTANTYNFNNDVIVQENLVATIEVLEYDLRKIGYCEDPLKIPNPAKSILYADSTEIKFLTDVDFNGTVDTLRYYLGPVSELTSTPNPNDRMLYRVVNGVKQGVNLGVTHFKMKFFGALNEELPLPRTLVPTGIQSMQIDIRVENTSAYESEYQYAFWREIRLASRNLSNR